MTSKISVITATSFGSESGTRKIPVVAVAEPAQDDDQQHALSSHPDGVCVSELVRRETAPHSGG